MSRALHDFKNELQRFVNPQRATSSARFFKTGKGEYGEGDLFLGLTVPECRKIAITYKDLSLEEIKQLLFSKFHEERLIALLILVHKFGVSSKSEQKEIVDFYLSNTNYINNWDLVDLSADKILGEWLYQQSFPPPETRRRTKEGVQVDKTPNNGSADHANPHLNPLPFGKGEEILESFAHSQNLWKRRIAIISTYAFIKHGIPEPTLKIAEILINDKHDLIQKAVGWMLREVGKRCSQEAEGEFLKKHYKTMPRTALRYAIERFPDKLRKAYLTGQV